jgi:hypothetical protein
MQLPSIVSAREELPAPASFMACAALVRPFCSRMRDAAEAEGFAIVSLEAPENRSLPGVLVPSLRAALLRLDRISRATAGVTRALRALAGFAKLKVKYTDLEVALDFEPEPGLADSGDLDADLADLMIAVAKPRASAAARLCW